MYVAKMYFFTLSPFDFRHLIFNFEHISVLNYLIKQIQLIFQIILI
jgi:hypothetical protein